MGSGRFAEEGSSCLGGENLLELLKNYCRTQNMKKSITVGIFGYPNTGKSSLINSMKRSKAVGVGAKPGFTRQMQEVKLDSNITLLDCPGIVFNSFGEGGGAGDDYNNADIVLRNAIDMEKIPDPVSVVDAVLRRCPRNRLMELYEIPAYRSSEEFLAYVAQKSGKLRKGGGPDYKAAAVSVLRDWQTGRIKFYTVPPERQSNAVVATEIVTQWAKEFDLDSLLQKEQETVVNKLHAANSYGPALMLSAGEVKSDAAFAQVLAGGQQAMDQDDDDEDDDENDEMDGGDDGDDDDDEEEDNEMDLSEELVSDEEVKQDRYAVPDVKKGSLVMHVANKAKPRDEPRRVKAAAAAMDDYVAPLTKAQRKNLRKKEEKRAAKKQMDVDDGDDEFEAEPYNMDEFVPVAHSNMPVDEEEEDYRF